MRCPYCGGSNPDNTNFCIRCGRDLIASTPNATAQRPAQPTRPTQNQPVRPALPAQQTGYQTPPRPTVPPGSPKPAIPSQPPTYPPQPTQYTQPAAYPPGPTRNTPPTTVPRPNTPSTTIPRPGITPTTPPATPIAKNVAVNTAGGKRSTTDANVLPSSQGATNEAPVPFPPETIGQLKALIQGALPYTLVTDAERYGKKKIVRIAYRQCVGWQQVGTLLKALKEYDTPEFDTIVIQGAFEQDKNTYYYTNGQLTFDRHVRLGSLVQDRYQIETGNGLSSDSVRFVISE